MKKILLNFILILLHLGCTNRNEKEIIVGSKKFTESVILGDVITQLGESNSIKVTHKKELGGTRILWNALLKGDIDIYPEYTGTIIQEIISEENIKDFYSLKIALRKYSVEISNPLGFNNTYALGMNRKRAVELTINKISDLNNYDNLKLGFTNLFIEI